MQHPLSLSEPSSKFDKGLRCDVLCMTSQAIFGPLEFAGEGKLEMVGNKKGQGAGL